MPSGKPIDWSLYDKLLIEQLHKHTICEWQKQYASHISQQAISKRARHLNICPKSYSPSAEHKHAISAKLRKETPEMIQKIKDDIDLFSRKDLAQRVGLSQARLNDLINRHSIKMSEQGYQRARLASVNASKGKVPWNKGKQLSEQHKINMAMGRQKMSGRLSKLQAAFYKICDENGITYLKEDHTDCRFGHWVFDCRIIHAGYDFLVEVQGDYIHSLPKNKAKDNAKFTYMQRYFPQIPIKYIWEHEFGAQNRVKQQIRKWLSLDQIVQVQFELKDTVIKEIDNDKAASFLAAFHYLGKLAGRFKYGVFLEDKLIAVAILSAPTRTEIATRFGLTPRNCLELRRFVIHDAYHKHNFGSYILSRIEKLLPADIKMLVSFADPGVGHDGTLYKASNWLLDGKSQPSYYYIDESGYVMLKKTLYNLANKMHMSEGDFAETYGYSKIATPSKLRYIRCLSR